MAQGTEHMKAKTHVLNWEVSQLQVKRSAILFIINSNPKNNPLFHITKPTHTLSECPPRNRGPDIFSPLKIQSPCNTQHCASFPTASVSHRTAFQFEGDTQHYLCLDMRGKKKKKTQTKKQETSQAGPKACARVGAPTGWVTDGGNSYPKARYWPAVNTCISSV